MAAKSYTLSLGPLEGGDDGKEKSYSMRIKGVGILKRLPKDGKPGNPPVASPITKTLTDPQVISLMGKTGVIVQPANEEAKAVMSAIKVLGEKFADAPDKRLVIQEAGVVKAVAEFEKRDKDATEAAKKAAEDAKKGAK